MNILFVCTGNTCRSPMAEGITRALAAEQHKDVTTVSAGLFAADVYKRQRLIGIVTVQSLLCKSSGLVK